MSTELPLLLNALRAIAEPTRLRIVALCRTGDLSVNELCQALGQSQPRISRHLKLLVDAGVLEKLPEGASVFHRLTRTGVGAEIARQVSYALPDSDVTLQHDQTRLAQVKHEREIKAAEYFRTNAQQWDSLRAMHVDDQNVEGMILSMLEGHETGDLLDIGTGTGRMLEILAPLATRAEGIDRSRSMLSIARTNMDRMNMENCHVRHGDMYSLPFDDGSFDTIMFHQVLHYVDDPELAVVEAVRVLRPGGQMMIVDFAPHNVEELRRNHAHHRLGFPTGEVKSWFENSELKFLHAQNMKGDPLTVSLWLAEKTTVVSNRSSASAIRRSPDTAESKHDTR